MTCARCTVSFMIELMFCKHADVKEDTDAKAKSKVKKKEPASMFQINGSKPDTKSKKKGEMR